MNRNLLEAYLEKCNSNYWFCIKNCKDEFLNYRFPRYIKDNIDLGNIWYSARCDNSSPYQKNWEDFINLKSKSGNTKTILENEKSGIFLYAREFPFLIDDKNLWIKCLKKFHIENESGNDKKLYKDKHYFLADYFFYKTGLIVEIDSGYHKMGYNELYDKARDLYILKNYGVKTYRIYQFRISDDDCKKFGNNFINISNKIYKSKKNSDKYIVSNMDFPINTMSYLINYWIDSNKDLYNIFNYIEDNFFLDDNIEINKSTIEQIIKKELTEIYKNNIISEFKYIYRTNLTIRED